MCLCLAAQIILLQTAFWMRDNSRLKLKDGPLPIVHDPAAPPEEVSLTLFICYEYLQIAFALSQKRGVGWAELISM